MIDELVLRKLYLDDGKSQSFLAKHFNCSRSNIQYFLKKFSIKKDSCLIKKDWLIEQYIILNKSQLEISKMLRCSRKNISYYLKKYKIIKDKHLIAENIKIKNFERYGVEHHVQDSLVKEKIKKTNLERYGGSISNNELIRKKKALTNLSKYGFVCPLMNKEVKQKTIATNLKKYGFKHHFSNPNIKRKIIRTLIKKYGVSSPIHNQEIKKRMIDTNLERYLETNPLKNSLVRAKAKNTNLNVYGYENPIKNDLIKIKIKNTNLTKFGSKFYFKSLTFKNKMILKGRIKIVFGKTLAEWAREYHLPVCSIYQWFYQNEEKTLEEFLAHLVSYKHKLTDIENIISQKFGLKHFNKYPNKMLRYKPDFKISSHCFLNVDGLYYHSSINQKMKLYHYNMRKTYESFGFRIFQFRADEVYKKQNIIKLIIEQAMNPCEDILNLHKAIAVKISNREARTFLESNHIKGYKPAKHIGLFQGNSLLSVLSYKVKKKSLSIERFCCKKDVNFNQAFKILINQPELNYLNLPIYYLIDLRYENGDYLQYNGFKPGLEFLNWEWTDFKKVYKKTKCMSRMDERMLSENEYAKELKLYKIYGAGQRFFVKG
jgi:predicted transcriptional regulator